LNSPAKGSHIGIFPSIEDQSIALKRLSEINVGSSELIPGAYTVDNGDFSVDLYHSYGEISSSNPSFCPVNLSVAREAEFNVAPSYDADIGKPLTLISDESLGTLKRVDYKLPDTTINDGNPSATLSLDNGIVFRKFRIVADIVGDLMPLTIQTSTKLLRNTDVAEVLDTGEIATPMGGFKSGTQAFIEITKGIGMGVVKISYQFQDPINKQRTNVPVWVIDLDDGQQPYSHKFLLPECSTSTMNGFKKLGTGTGLSWIIEAVRGPVSIKSRGQNLADTPPVKVFLKTLNPGDYIDGKFVSDYYEGFEINKIDLIMTQQQAGRTTTLSNIKVEVEL
jgi:hypothetical protein